MGISLKSKIGRIPGHPISDLVSPYVILSNGIEQEKVTNVAVSEYNSINSIAAALKYIG